MPEHHSASSVTSDDTSSDDENIFFRVGGDVFEETEENTQKREAALLHQTSIANRTWGSASHEARWAGGSTRERVFTLRNAIESNTSTTESQAVDQFTKQDSLNPDALSLSQTATTQLRIIETPGQQMCLWDCSLVLARFLEAKRSLVTGKRVIELGCGLGLPGLVAGALGSKYVLLTDRPLIVRVLEQEIEMNGSVFRQQGSDVHAQTLEWGRGAGIQAAARIGALSATQNSSNSNESGDAETQSHAAAVSDEIDQLAEVLGFDVVLCSDLVYAGDSANTKLLVDTVVALQSSVNVEKDVSHSSVAEEEKRTSDVVGAVSNLSSALGDVKSKNATVDLGDSKCESTTGISLGVNKCSASRETDFTTFEIEKLSERLSSTDMVKNYESQSVSTADKRLRFITGACVVSCYEERSEASIQQNEIFRNGLMSAGYVEVVVKHTDMDQECQDSKIKISVFWAR